MNGAESLSLVIMVAMKEGCGTGSIYVCLRVHKVDSMA